MGLYIVANSTTLEHFSSIIFICKMIRHMFTYILQYLPFFPSPFVSVLLILITFLTLSPQSSTYSDRNFSFLVIMGLRLFQPFLLTASFPFHINLALKLSALVTLLSSNWDTWQWISLVTWEISQVPGLSEPSCFPSTFPLAISDSM